ELLEDRHGDADRRRPRLQVRPPEQRAQVAAVQVLHRDEVRAADPAELVDAADVVVLQALRHARLARERPDEGGVLRQMRQESLERHLLTRSILAVANRPVYDRHPTRAQPLVDLERPELLAFAT